MIIYNFVTGKKYGEAVTKELEKICKEKHYKTGLFATVKQMQTNSSVMVCKGQKAHKVTMFISGQKTFFCLFNIAQCFINAEIKKLKTKTVYSENCLVYPPKDASMQDLQELQQTLEKIKIPDGNGILKPVMLDFSENLTPKFNYQEYKARKIARLQELEKAQKEFEEKPLQEFSNIYGMGDIIENCPF